MAGRKKKVVEPEPIETGVIEPQDIEQAFNEAVEADKSSGNAPMARARTMESVARPQKLTYRVLEKWHGTIAGRKCNFAEGDTFNPGLYGSPEIIAHFEKAGLKVEKIG